MEKVFVNGLIVKDAKPDFIKCKLSFKVDEIIEFLKKNNNNGWVNVDVCESRNGKLYASLNDWKPTQQNDPSNGWDQFDGDSIPF